MPPLAVLRQSWFFYRHNLPRIARLCLPWLLLEGLLRTQLGDWLGTPLQAGHEVLIGLLFYPLYSALLILFLDDRSHDRQHSDGELLARALQLWPRFAVLTGLSTLLVMFGFALLVLPGLWLLLRLAYADYLLVLGGLAPLAALRESFRLTGQDFWQIAVCLLLAMLPLQLLEWWSFDLLGTEPAALPSILVDSLNGLLQLFVTVVAFRLFLLQAEDPNSAPH